MRVNSLRLITRLVTDRRPTASRLAQPVAWLEEYLQPATLKGWLPKTLDCPLLRSAEETLEQSRVSCITVVALFRVGFFPLPAWSPVWLPGGWVFFPAWLAKGLEPGYIRLPFALAPMDRVVLDFIWLKPR